MDVPQTTILSFQPVEIIDSFKGVMIELVQILDRDADDEIWRLLEAARATSLLMTTFSMDGRVLIQNPAALACYGGPQLGNPAKNLESRFLDKSLEQSVLSQAKSDETTKWEAEVITAKGVRTHLLSVRKGRDPITGDFVLVLSEEDVTEQAKLRRLQQSEKEALQHEVAESSDKLRISTERYRLAAETAAIWDWDASSNEIFVSPNFIVSLGYTQENFPKVTGDNVVETIVHPADLPAYKDEIRKHFSNSDYPLSHEVRFLTKSGDERWFQTQGTCVRNDEGRVTRSVGLLTDITNRKILEATLLISQRMDAIGQLTGGIAHDFNNLLTVIQGNAQLLDEMGGTDRELTQEIVHAVQRGSDLTKHLLAFAKQQTLLPKSVDLNNLIPKLEKTLLRAISETIEIEFVAQSGLWDVYADPTQIETAILNLAFNARDAMPDGGTLSIKCANKLRSDIKDSGSLELGEDAYVEIAVTDSGSGMSKDAILKAFEPFFTTKKFGKGSGLGLSMVLGFSRQSKGDARITSNKSGGTTVTLYLPKSDHAQPSTAPIEKSGVRLGNHEHVHILEDNQQVQETVARLVRSLGYEVSTSSDVSEAMAAVQDAPDTDIFLLDILLPGGKSGVDFARELKATRPDAKILLMSGYPEAELTKNSDLKFEFISKPFDKAAISEAIKIVLMQH